MANKQNNFNKRSVVRFVPLAIFLIIITVFFVQLGKDASIVPSAFINKPMPSFTGEKLGNYPKLENDNFGNGKITVLNVFASWCLPCKIEHPLISELAKTVPVFGLAWKDKPADTMKWLDKMGNAYARVLSDESGRAGIAMGVYGVPETYIVNKAGIIVYRHVGAITRDVLKNEILEKLKKLNQSEK